MIRLPIPDNEAQAGAAAALGSSDGAVTQAKRSADESGFGEGVASPYDSERSATTLQRSDLMPYAVRMVTPMRREFGRTMDVTHFLYDTAYAREIIAQAKASRDARLRGYAVFLDMRLLGAPAQEAAAASRATPASEPAATVADPGPVPDAPAVPRDFAGAKAYAAESLSQLLGPSSERLCRRIASAVDMDSFVDVFDRAYSVVREMHGADEAVRYGAAVEARLGSVVSVMRGRGRRSGPVAIDGNQRVGLAPTAV